MKALIHSLTLGLLLVSPVLAQEAEQPEKPAAKGRVAYFIYTDLPEGVENPVTLMTGKDVQKLALSKRMASDAVKIPADGIVRLVKKNEAPSAADPSPYTTIAQAAIPEGVDKALVILMPIKAQANGVIFQCKVQNLASFKGGDYLYLNLTTLNVGVEMGATKILVKPGQTSIYSAPNLSDATNMAVRYSFFDPAKEEWLMLSASTVVSQATRREICIFSWDPRYNRMDYHGITFPVSDKENTL